MARGKHPVPSRTRKLSLSAPMVLHAGVCGRLGRCRTLLSPRSVVVGGIFFCFFFLCFVSGVCLGVKPVLLRHHPKHHLGCCSGCCCGHYRGCWSGAATTRARRRQADSGPFWSGYHPVPSSRHRPDTASTRVLLRIGWPGQVFLGFPTTPVSVNTNRRKKRPTRTYPRLKRFLRRFMPDNTLHRRNLPRTDDGRACQPAWTGFLKPPAERGSSTSTMQPDPALRIVTTPPWAATMVRTIARPRPLPELAPGLRA